MGSSGTEALMGHSLTGLRSLRERKRTFLEIEALMGTCLPGVRSHRRRTIINATEALSGYSLTGHRSLDQRNETVQYRHRPWKPNVDTLPDLIIGDTIQFLDTKKLQSEVFSFPRAMFRNPLPGEAFQISRTFSMSSICFGVSTH